LIKSLLYLSTPVFQDSFMKQKLPIRRSTRFSRVTQRWDFNIFACLKINEFLWFEHFPPANEDPMKFRTSISCSYLKTSGQVSFWWQKKRFVCIFQRKSTVLIAMEMFRVHNFYKIIRQGNFFWRRQKYLWKTFDSPHISRFCFEFSNAFNPACKVNWDHNFFH